MDVRDRIKSAPMTRFQVRVVVICLLVNMADGFDVLVMSFTSIGVGDEWGLSGRELGVLLSSGLVGMAVGSLFIAPLADRVGRRKLTLLGVAARGRRRRPVRPGRRHLRRRRLHGRRPGGGQLADHRRHLRRRTARRGVDRGLARWRLGSGLRPGNRGGLISRRRDVPAGTR